MLGLLSKSFTKMAKVIQQMSKITVIGIVLVAILALAACTGQDTQKPVTATWIQPQVAGDTVSIPVSEVSNNKIVHFNVAVASGNDMAFMAYHDVDEELNVRANVCPPCRSIGFSLSKDTLVCDTCRTTFEAKTGDGISGGCIEYPKAAVPYEISSGKVVMNSNELLVAYQNTLESGRP
ncbi:Fe-S-containing protein [Chloroflexota bacterium]